MLETGGSQDNEVSSTIEGDSVPVQDELRAIDACSDSETESIAEPSNTDPIKLSNSVIMFRNSIADGVWRGKCTKDDMELAIKLLDSCEKSEREVDIITRLNHENIVKVIDVGKYRHIKNSIYIAMEFHPENLADHIANNKEKPFDFLKCFSFSKQLVTAIVYLHREQVVHCDLKPWNVLVAKDGKSIKVTDMGLSKGVKYGSYTNKSDMQLGTPGYKAPETYGDWENGGEGNGKYHFSCDIFPLGINICYIFANGRHPFGENPHLWVGNIVRHNPPDLTIIQQFEEPYTEKHGQLVKLIGTMLDNDCKNRPSAREVLDNDFFQASDESFETNESSSTDSDSILGFNETERIRISDIVDIFPPKSLSKRRNVYQGEITSDILKNRQCAIKILGDSDQSNEEVKILGKLGAHEYVTLLIQSGVVDGSMFSARFLALELCHEDNLDQYLRKRSYSLQLNLKYCSQIIEGMKYIHQKCIIHKDLKPSNILLTLDRHSIKIADFGISQEIRSERSMVFHKNRFGTVGYRPPESFGNSYISLKSDNFSLGVLFHFIMSNGISSFGPERDLWEYKVINGDVDVAHLCVPNRNTFEHLFKFMMSKERQRRPTIWQIEEHPCWKLEETDCKFDYGWTDEIDDSSDERACLPQLQEVDSIDEFENLSELIEILEMEEEKIKDQPKTPSLPPSNDEDCSESAPVGKDWTRLTDTLYMNIKKPLKKGVKVFNGIQMLLGGWFRVAIKIIHCTELRNESYNEVAIIRNLEQHSNVIKVYDAKVMEDEKLPFIYISMPLYPKTLRDIINESDQVNLEECISYADQIVNGVAFIHEHEIQHRDIKPENILISSKGHCLISDFGLSKEIQDGQTTVIISEPVAGTEGYQAPEIHKKPPRYSYRSDSFSIGVVFSMLFSCGAHPYGIVPEFRRTNIMKNKGPNLSRVEKEMKPYPKKQKQLLRLILKLLSHDPKNRPLPKDILQDPFFKRMSYA